MLGKSDKDKDKTEENEQSRDNDARRRHTATNSDYDEHERLVRRATRSIKIAAICMILLTIIAFGSIGSPSDATRVRNETSNATNGEQTGKRDDPFAVNNPDAYDAAQLAGNPRIALAIDRAYEKDYPMARATTANDADVLVDMQTGLEYIGTDSGITPRFDADGRQMQSAEWKKYIENVTKDTSQE